MAYSKVILNGTALIDLTNDTVAADKVVSGYTATKNDGIEVSGSIPVKTSTDITVNGKTVSVPAGYYASAQSKDVATATPAFTGGTLSAGSTATGTNVTLSSTNNGIKVQTVYTAATTAVTYDGAINGYVTKANGAEAVAAQTISATNGTAYYVTDVTVPTDTGFSVTTTADTALDATSDLDVLNNAYRKTNVVNKPYGEVDVANGVADAISWTTGRYITTNQAIGATIPMTTKAYTGWKYCVINCVPGEKFVVTVSGGSNPRAWCFATADNVKLSGEAANTTVTLLEITAPATAAKLILNSNLGDDTVVIRKSGTTNVTNTGITNVSSASIGAGDTYISAYDSKSSATQTTRQIVESGVWVEPYITQAGTYYGKAVVDQGSGTLGINAPGDGSIVLQSSDTGTSGIYVQATVASFTAGYFNRTDIPNASQLYLKSIKLPLSRTFSITVYADATHQNTFTFTTDANGNTTVTGS